MILNQLGQLLHEVIELHYICRNFLALKRGTSVPSFIATN
jgi:hypothetical protein